MLASASAATWLWLTLMQGPLLLHDSEGYLALADALQARHAAVTERPDRTPGYPVFLVLCRAVGALFGWNALTIATIVQTILVAGLGTWLVFDMGRRLTATAPAIVAALLFATDVDVQVFGRAVMTEAQATWLIILTGWLRVRDGDWRRARWTVAALALTRPHLACIAGGFAVLELARWRVRSAASLAAPTALALLAWLLFASATGGLFLEGSRRMQALHQFGTAYEAELWRKLPPGDLRTSLSRAWEGHQDAYQAARSLTGQSEPWNPGGDWRPLAAAATAMIRTDPLGYVWARACLIPVAYREPVFPWAILSSAPDGHSPDGHIVAWSQLATLGRLHHGLLYGSFSVFVALALLASVNGFGYAEAVYAIRGVIVPLIGMVLAGTALLSLSSYEVGRLGLPAHPFVELIWAFALGGAVRAASRVRLRRGAAPAARLP